MKLKIIYIRLLGGLVVAHTLGAGMACAEIPSGPPVSSVPSETMKKDNKVLFARWAKIKEPSMGSVDPTGAYSAGCLFGAAKLQLNGTGYAVMRPSRKRYYGHPSTISYLHGLGERLHAAKLPLLLIGDVSPPRGGPMNSGHNSHQIGLDVDIWLRMSRVRPSPRNREKWTAVNFVVGRKKLKDSWSGIQIQLISAAADFPEVNRIFVSPAIKKYFCDNHSAAPWLYKLRSWWSHEDHIHVRLNCPSDSVNCQPQPALEARDNSCGKELHMTLSKEADDEWDKIVHDTTERQFPDLPPSCEDLVKDVSVKIEAK